MTGLEQFPGDKPDDIGELINTAFSVSHPSPEAVDLVKFGEERLAEIAEEHRRLQLEHSDEYYRLRDEDPEEAEVHHGHKYDHMGIAAAIERAQIGMRWGSRPTWLRHNMLDVLGITKKENELELQAEQGAIHRINREDTAHLRDWSTVLPGVPQISETDFKDAA